MQLELLGGPQDGLLLMLEKDEVYVGRDDSDDVNLYYDRTASRRHLVIAKKHAGFFAKDHGHDGKGSHHGTFLNARNDKSRFRNEGRSLNPGDILFVGHIGIRLVL
jgi:pSer/pThr/pTyr-binding forkhead associated (FHA) protein